MVTLVGAGPGDAGLLTRRGYEALQAADCVLYDGLVSAAVLTLLPARAERIAVAKSDWTQDQINALLIEKARTHAHVVRLKGGDPLLFGRAASELGALRDAGIAFEIVPGVSSVSGAAAMLGLPLTANGSLLILSGHAPDDIPYAAAAQAGTIALYMPTNHLTLIAGRLIAAGMAASTPLAAVSRATQPGQRVVRQTLGTATAVLESPWLVLIGAGVDDSHYAWFERRPLSGQRIVVTRDRSQAGALAERLEAWGAAVIELPVIELAPPADSGPLDSAIGHLEEYDWILFTSANAVRRFFARLFERGRDARAIRARLCAIGPATRAAVESFSLRVDLMPAEYAAEGLVAAFQTQGSSMAGCRILLPRAAVARDLVPDTLRAMGAQLDLVEVYRTMIPADAASRAQEVLAGPPPDWITFTSSSTVKNLLAVAGREAVQGARLASIGSATTETAQRHGLTIHAEASPSTIDGLVEAILRAAPR
jgi:uroporphyrinogen III methyltransferase/synthase